MFCSNLHFIYIYIYTRDMSEALYLYLILFFSIPVPRFVSINNRHRTEAHRARFRASRAYIIFRYYARARVNLRSNNNNNRNVISRVSVRRVKITPRRKLHVVNIDDRSDRVGPKGNTAGNISLKPEIARRVQMYIPPRGLLVRYGYRR